MLLCTFRSFRSFRAFVSPFTLALSAALSACGTDTDAPAARPEPAASVTEASALACADDDLASAGPFRGPGYDESRGGLLGERRPSYLAATTVFAYSTEPAAQRRFRELIDEVLAQTLGQPGFLGHELAFSEKCKYGRTITLWEDEASMMNFVTSGAHATAMTEVRVVGVDGRTIDWDVTPDELPISWATARARLVPVLP
ncbi:MAG: antibiotic biosynthesis monooxygenase [Polyangiaceae bacterium]|jgi:heme-degrading monooxygenase HmoA|nr:antibiotic biosynthesis monooxygenase [Polyangiaceae bacterium]